MQGFINYLYIMIFVLHSDAETKEKEYLKVWACNIKGIKCNSDNNDCSSPINIWTVRFPRQLPLLRKPGFGKARIETPQATNNTHPPPSRGCNIGSYHDGEK
jgi:hypothetical protein